jgi:tRNA nucleotidyltransferase/poly(A) polymerase
MVLKWATKMEQIPEMFRAMAGFLKKEPDENFSFFHNIPLSVNEKALASFEKAMSKFPEVVSSGKAQTTPLNFVITTGQMLTNIAMILDLYANHPSPELREKYKNLKSPIDEFFKLWGSYKKMNVTLLAQEYKNKSVKETKNSLIEKLDKSTDIVENKILPGIKAVQQ